MLQPLHDYVLLKREKEEKTTASGIILTSGKEKSKLAVVAAIGSGVKDCEYALNDKVLYNMVDNSKKSNRYSGLRHMLTTFSEYEDDAQ